MTVTRAQIAKAKALLKDKRAAGDHGFKGRQLTAWNRQRNTFKKRLEKVIKGTTLTSRDREWPKCPREVVPQFVAGLSATRNCMTCPPGKGCNVNGRMKNPKWSGGTRGGQAWCSAVDRLIRDVRLNNF